ncbi:hypothetical protein [Sphingobium sp. CAP-1]|uniref:hypothetical protein n=1 Tax=Sphingobium sp. CAP-1 TaxID=2676077 RepID=UPI0012BB3B47|nr:hypothetical protein [Sphingobium sp. CAP-1]QGP80453.1 hypothetical protein GL174_15050 [Sphingobium sp. CAP-1]
MMRMFEGLQPTAAMLLLLCAGCSGGGEASNSVDKTAKTPPVSFDTRLPLKMVMEHIITPAAFGVWGASGYELSEKGERDLAPRTDAEWEQVVNHAATLQESMNLLLLPGRVRDESWPGYVGAVSGVATRMLAAAEAHDEKTLARSGDELVEACEACHSAYQMPAAKYQRPDSHR